jgi:hypothetical protein
MMKSTTLFKAMAAAAVLAMAIPAFAAPPPVSSAETVSLTVKKGGLGAALNQFAKSIGATVEGDVAALSKSAQPGVYQGAPRDVLARLLADADYAVRTHPDGRIKTIVVLSGARGGDPAKRPSSQTFAAAPQPQAGPTVTAGAAQSALGATATEKAPTAAGAAPPLPPVQTAEAGAFGRAPTDTRAAAASSPPAQVTITPQMQADIAAATARAQQQLQQLVTQLKATCPAGQTC